MSRVYSLTAGLELLEQRAAGEARYYLEQAERLAERATCVAYVTAIVKADKAEQAAYSCTPHVRAELVSRASDLRVAITLALQAMDEELMRLRRMVAP